MLSSLTIKLVFCLVYLITFHRVLKYNKPTENELFETNDICAKILKSKT